jgi:hypothetical protein
MYYGDRARLCITQGSYYLVRLLHKEVLLDRIGIRQDPVLVGQLRMTDEAEYEDRARLCITQEVTT